MAYQNVGTPRFYINVLEWLASVGYTTGLNNIFRTLPVNPVILTEHTYPVSLTAMTDNGFIALLGHDLPNYNNYAYIEEDGIAIVLSNVVNSAGGSTDHINPSDDGFSIATFSGSPNIDSFNLYYANSSNAGSVIIGTYYDMPHSPDLSLTMTREMDGVKRLRTLGGSDLVNYKYIRPTPWGSLPAWGIGGADYSLSRTGRRVWDLSFSSLQDSDVFPMLSSLNPYESVSATGDVYSSSYIGDNPLTDEIEIDAEVPETTWHNSNTLLDSDNFYSQVIHKTNGGQLPFIFQPDTNNNTSDNFAICKFDMQSFKVDQVANGVYNIKLKIREAW